MVVDDQGSQSTPTKSDDSDVKFFILNLYNRNSNNVSKDDASLNRSTSPVAKGDPPSSKSSL